MLQCGTQLNQTGHFVTVEWFSGEFPDVLTDIIDSYNVFTSDDDDVSNMPRQVWVFQ